MERRQKRMALMSKAPGEHAQRRIWRKPGAKANWFWLIVSLLIYGGVSGWYFYALKTQKFPGPYNDPFRLFGIISFVLVLLVAAYSLRRRFVRVLPGSVQNWLWLHTWFGIISLLIAFQHENYLNILNNFSFTPSRFVEATGGTSALYALLLLVVSGIIGRLIDGWQARVIALEAHRNGVGIASAVKARLQEVDLLLERLYAGRSAAFKQFCLQAMQSRSTRQSTPPLLPIYEQDDFDQASTVLVTRQSLLRSLRRQQRAQSIIQAWRSIHIPLACLALAIISVHSLLELAKMALQLLRHG